MKSLNEINSILTKFEEKYKYKVVGAQQKSEVWYKLHLGVISASNAKKFLSGRDTDTRATYMAGLIAQIGTGLMPEFKSYAIDWGNQYEDAARAYYEMAVDGKITELPFVFKDESFRIGCSPDGLISDKKGMEIKCPYDSANFVEFYVADKVKPDWKYQCQFTMWVLQAEQWDFCQYDPRMQKTPLKIRTIDKDEKIHKTLDDAVPQFIADMDKNLKEMGLEYGDQWLNLAAP